MKYLFLIFVLTPIIEMWVLIEVGGVIGALPTIGLVLLTAMIGLSLLRQQGFATLFRARQKMSEGKVPAQELVEGIFLAVGGALLLTPGFVTDAIGFICLLPGLRHLLIMWGVKHLKPSVRVYGTGYVNPESQSSEQQNTIDGVYHREDENR